MLDVGLKVYEFSSAFMATETSKANFKFISHGSYSYFSHEGVNEAPYKLY